jgi:hypothetical protein
MAPIGRQALTALLPVRTGREASLAAAIAEAGPALAARLEAASSLHFARVIVVPGDDTGGHATAAWLLFETTYDGELRAHVVELFALAGVELGRLFAECEGVSARGGLDEFEQTLRRGSRRPWAFSAKNAELGVADIRRDAMLRESVVERLERERASLGREQPLQILLSLRRELGFESASSTSTERAPIRHGAGEPWLVLAKLVPLVLAMVLRDVRERVLGLWHDRIEPLRPSTSPAIATVPARRFPQRAFTHLALPKPGRFRRRALQRALALIGSLLGPDAAERSVPAVHTHRFVLLDDGRLLFTDQQDGSLTNLLGALDRREKSLLALVWSSTEGFPRALLGHLLGKTDDDRLLEWLRERELASGFYYSAYPTLTVRDVAVNAELRAILSAEPTVARARRLLELV